MTVIKFSKRYQTTEKKFTKHNLSRIDAIEKALKLFRKNPVHPSLNLEKLSGVGIWTIRISEGNRIFLIWLDKDTALLIDIGKHDKYRKY